MLEFKQILVSLFFSKHIIWNYLIEKGKRLEEQLIWYNTHHSHSSSTHIHIQTHIWEDTYMATSQLNSLVNLSCASSIIITEYPPWSGSVRNSLSNIPSVIYLITVLSDVQSSKRIEYPTSCPEWDWQVTWNVLVRSRTEMTWIEECETLSRSIR